MSELIAVRDGVGGGGGGSGGGGGGGGGGTKAACARAGGDAATTAKTRTKATPTALESLPPAPVSFAREGRDEQHMNAIPRSNANLTKCKIPSAGGDLPPVLPGGQSVLVLGNRQLADIVVPLPQVARGGLIVEQIYQGAPEAC
jgi:hypothetical protein